MRFCRLVTDPGADLFPDAPIRQGEFMTEPGIANKAAKATPPNVARRIRANERRMDADLREMARMMTHADRVAVYFPGSTIGNFEPQDAKALLTSMREFVGSKGAALIGADLVKGTDVLEAAYDDSQGITAEFNKNVLARINQELGGTFDLDGFKHRARYDETAARIEMWLDCTASQTVTIAGRTFRFEAGESILTEYSHKYTQHSFDALARSAGFATAKTWTDADERFSVQLVAG